MVLPTSFRCLFPGLALGLIPASLSAQTPAAWRLQTSGSQAELRGISAPGGTVAWATGAKGTVLRTLDGHRWETKAAPEGTALDRTGDGGDHWTLQFANTDPASFLDAFAFWDATHGIALGDVLQGRFQVLITEDGGATWKPVPPGALPLALPGEGAFAASGTCLVTTGARDAWFVTGGAKASRVFHTSDRGRTWAVAESPVPANGPALGLFSVAFSTAGHGVAVGGDYQQKADLPITGARTEDGGRTWIPASLDPQGFHSAVVAIPGSAATFLSLGLAGTGLSRDGGRTWAPLDRTPFNAVAFADAHHGWAVGPRGTIAAYAGPALAGPQAPRR
ncbi:MAG: hypothetical protein HYZ13_05685 [Acidobacteria bacterium]|nr:hypothetical protein [Acidobacteriota bacterium]